MKNSVALIQFIRVNLLSVGYIKIINNMYMWVIWALVISTMQQSIRQKLATPVEGGDLSFLRALNNYYGCKTWDDIECVECSPGYFFNDNKICSKITDQCKKFNRAVGICEECYIGYQVYSGQCILEGLASSLDLGCKKFEVGKCIQCSVRYYFGSNGHCQPVSDLCRKWNQNTGQCTDCYQGYHVVNGVCQQIKIPSFGSIDAFCGKWQGRKCLQCAQRAYFGPIGLCIPVNDFCRTWDKYDGFCLTCYGGYDLEEGKCVESEKNIAPPPDMGCKVWDWDNQICLQCSYRWVFNTLGVCVPVSDNCKIHKQGGDCVECYPGYDIQQGQCVFSQKNLQGPTDLGCKIWDWEQLKCLQCSQRWTFNDEKLCVPVSNQCKYFNRDTGECTGCYLGYDVENGRCSLAVGDLKKPTDPGCKIWDWQEQVCMQCSFRWVFQEDGQCKKVSQKCDTYGAQGECLTCYKGYEIKQGQCVESQADYCEIRQDGVCKLCYLGYILENNNCVMGNPLCKQIDGQGNCTSCFKTYALYKNICVPLVKLVNLAEYYASCCPDLLEKLLREGRMKA